MFDERNNHYLIPVKKNQKLYITPERIIKENRPNTVYIEQDNIDILLVVNAQEFLATPHFRSEVAEWG